MVAESYGAWGEVASAIILRLAISTCKPKSVVLNDIYSRLNVHLVRASATAILSKDSTTSTEQDILLPVFLCCVFLK